MINAAVNALLGSVIGIIALLLAAGLLDDGAEHAGVGMIAASLDH